MCNLVNVGDLIIQNQEVGYCYKTGENTIFVKWFVPNVCEIFDQYWFNGEIEDWISFGYWKVIKGIKNV